MSPYKCSGYKELIYAITAIEYLNISQEHSELNFAGFTSPLGSENADLVEVNNLYSDYMYQTYRYQQNSS